MVSSRNVEGYACEVYLENLCNPDNYQSNMQVFIDILTKADFCSPLHSRDKNKDGTFKKAHYHLLFNRDVDKQTISAMLGCIATTEELLVKGRKIIPIYHYNNYYKYLTHSDKKSMLDPTKADYSKERLLWKNPQVDEPEDDITEFQGLVNYYNEHCRGLDYNGFINYVIANCPVLLGCQDIHKFAFITYVRSEFLNCAAKEDNIREQAILQRSMQSKDAYIEVKEGQDYPWE